MEKKRKEEMKTEKKDERRPEALLARSQKWKESESSDSGEEPVYGDNGCM